MKKGYIFLAVMLIFVLSACQDSSNLSTSENPTLSSNTENDGDTSNNAQTIETIKHTFDPSAENILNPERGAYDWIDILDTSDDFTTVRGNGYSIAFDNVEIGDYVNSTLPNSFLNDLRTGFKHLRDAGIKIVLRFQYSDTFDAPLQKILEHIEQLKPILRENQDVIAVFQAGFIGRWGEWHSSTNGLDNAASRKEVLNALLNAMPDRMIQVRTPEFKTEYLGSNNIDPNSKVAHHNDCFLASNTDMGTYPSDNIEFWKSYIAQDGNYVPIGGETCEINPPRSDCTSAVDEMKRLHWSFIIYHGDVIESWEKQGCGTEIKKNLGYRLVLKDGSWNETLLPAGALSFEINLANEGYAAPYNARPLYVVLKGESCYSAKIAADPRTWTSGKDSNIKVTIKVPATAVAGDYKLALWLPDSMSSLTNNPLYSIQFANAGTWGETDGYNILDTAIKIDKSETPYSGNVDATFEPCK